MQLSELTVNGIFFGPPLIFQKIVGGTFLPLCVCALYFSPSHLRYGNIPRVNILENKNVKIPFLKWDF